MSNFLNYIDLQRPWYEAGAQFPQFALKGVFLQNLSEDRFYCLTGAPGAGKSRVIKQYRDQNAHSVLYYSFAELHSRKDMAEWITASLSSQSELFIDAYDERSGAFCEEVILEPLRASKRAGILPRLRVVSRGHHLSEELLYGIAEIYAIDARPGVSKYELSDLDEHQIEYWAEQRLGDSAKPFLHKVEELGLWQFTRRPFDLDSLIRIYCDDQELGADLSKIWDQGIRHELEETNDKKKKSTTCTADDKYRVLQVIAVWQMICHTGQKQTFTREQALSLWEDIGALFTSYDVGWYKRTLDAALDTPLVECGSGQYSFSSHAKAQFLAASKLSDLEPRQLINLFKDHYIGMRVPEMARAVVAELSQQLPAVFDWVLDNHPEALLHSISNNWKPSDVSRIADRFLEQANELEWWRYFGNIFAKADKSATLISVQKTLKNADASEQELHVALAIVSANGWEEARESVREIAFNLSNCPTLRSYAARALASIGGVALIDLKALCRQEPEADPDCEILGIALREIWPTAFSPSEAFEVLRFAPESFLGAYHMFLKSEHAASKLSKDYVEEGLKWICSQDPSAHRIHNDFETFERELIAIAWKNLEYQSCLESLANYSQKRLESFPSQLFAFQEVGTLFGKNTNGLPKREFDIHPEKRLKIFSAWLNIANCDRHSWDIWCFLDPAEHLNELIALAASSEDRNFLVDGIRNGVMMLLNQGKLESSGVIRSNLALLGIDIDMISLQLEEQRRRTNRRDEWEIKEQARLEKLQQEFEARLNEYVLAGSSTTFEQWFVLLGGHDPHHSEDWSKPVVTWKQWTLLSDEVRGQILSSARAFLTKADPTNVRLPQSDVLWSDIYAFGAIGLILDSDPNWMPPHLREWVYRIFAYNFLMFGNQEAVLGLADHLTPQIRVSTLKRVFDSARYRDETEAHGYRFEKLLDQASLVILAKESRSWVTRHRIWSIEILRLREPKLLAKELAYEWDHNRERMKNLVVQESFLHRQSTLLKLVEDEIIADDDLTKVACSAIWSRFPSDSGPDWKDVKTELLVILFERTVEVANPVEDERRSSARVTDRHFKESVRTALATEILSRLDDIAEEFFARWSIVDGFEWMPNWRRRSGNLWIELHWSPPPLFELVKLFTVQNFRVIRTQQDLHDAVVFALERIRTGEEGNALYRQKDRKTRSNEEAITMNLSKSLRRELEGLTVNAEVKSDNTRTDIQIEAANRHLGNRLKCVIEAKPCEKSPEKVIHDQLIPKYLTKNDGSTGIVLVLWFCRGPKLCKACANQASLIAKIDQEANDCPRTVSVVHYNIH